MTTPREPRKIFVLRFEGRSNNNESAHLHALWRVLKVLLRSYDLRCTDAREVADNEGERS